MRMSILPRWVHQLYAAVFGYCWGRCPLCGQKFGGHEWRSINGLSASITDKDKPNTGHGICPCCTKEGKGDEKWAPVVF
jgi:hypothetical protein